MLMTSITASDLTRQFHKESEAAESRIEKAPDFTYKRPKVSRELYCQARLKLVDDIDQTRFLVDERDCTCRT